MLVSKKFNKKYGDLFTYWVWDCFKSVQIEVLLRYTNFHVNKQKILVHSTFADDTNSMPSLNRV